MPHSPSRLESIEHHWEGARAGRSSSGAVAESCSWFHKHQTESQSSLGIVCAVWNFPPYLMWHTSSSKATHPKPSQIVPQTWGQVFKSMSLWGSFTFNPSHLQSYVSPLLVIVRNKLQSTQLGWKQKSKTVVSQEQEKARGWDVS